MQVTKDTHTQYIYIKGIGHCNWSVPGFYHLWIYFENLLIIVDTSVALLLRLNLILFLFGYIIFNQNPIGYIYVDFLTVKNYISYHGEVLQECP